MAVKKDVEETQKVRERIKKWDDHWRFNTQQYHEFVSFVMGSQWTEDESKLFIDYKKIPLTANKLAPLINNLCGDQRMNTPNLQVVPGDGVDLETSKVREALVKDISLNSIAKIVYQNSFQCAAVGGYGAYRIDTEYENENSMNLVIVLKELRDPTICYWDIGAESPCKVDGMYAGFRVRMTRKKFAALHGKKLETMIGSEANYDEGSATGWIFSNDEEITIIHDYQREYIRSKIYQLSNGLVLEKKQLNELEKVKIDKKEFLIYEGEIVTVVKERETYDYKIKYRKIAGDYLLEENDFPSKQLPIIFVDQNSYLDKSGKQICRPFVKDARDAQRFLNYLFTQSAYLVKVSRYDQFLVSKANVRSPDTQLIWRDPCTAQGGLVYDESPNGNIPQQLHPPEMAQSLIGQYQRTLADIETSTGMYGTQMGEQGNEISGAAIDARTRKGNKNTYIPFDSLNRAIAVGGEIINEMIPLVYDTERTLKLNMPDTGIEEVTLNQSVDAYGSEVKNDMTKGRYKIRLLPGASFEGQKQENLTSIQTILQADPQLFRLVADLYVENLPLANNIELRNRLRTIVPQEIIEAGKTGKPLPPKPQQPPPEVMMKMQELQMRHQEVMANLQLKMQEIQIKQGELQLKSAQTGQDISMAWKKLETERLEAAARLQEQELRYQGELHRVSADLQISHADNLVRLLTHQPKERANV